MPGNGFLVRIIDKPARKSSDFVPWPFHRNRIYWIYYASPAGSRQWGASVPHWHGKEKGTAECKVHGCNGSTSWVRWNFGRVCWRALEIWGLWPHRAGHGGVLLSAAAAGGYRSAERRCPWRTAGLCVQLGRSCFGRYGHVFVLAAHRQALLLACRLPLGQAAKSRALGPIRHHPPCSCCRCCRLPPTSFMHLAFGISDFDEKRYLVTVMPGPGHHGGDDGAVRQTWSAP